MNIAYQITLAVLLLVASAAPARAASLEETYMRNCSVCHMPGIAGAPKVGEKSEWTRRVRPGMATVYRNALEGIPYTAMAAKGGHADLGDDEVKAIVDYMIAAATIDRDVLLAATRYEKRGITDREFIGFDTDYDGFLSRGELAGDPVLLKNLSRFDADRDGKLSPAEYRNAESTLVRERAAVDVPDDALASTVRAAVSRIPGIDVQNTKVEAVRGAVSIIGIVDSAEVARRTDAVVKRIDGVRKIDNRLVSVHQMGWD